MQWLVVAAVLAPIALRDVERRRPRTWGLFLVPGLFLVLSIDEVARLHERLGVWLDEAAGIGRELPYTGGWFFVVVPAAGAWAVVAAVVFWPYLRERREAVTLLVAGLSLLLTAAVGLEFSSNFLPEHGNLHRAEIFGEEVLEMIAANLVLWGAVLIAREEGIRLDTGAPAQADPEAGAPTRSSRRGDEEALTGGGPEGAGGGGPRPVAPGESEPP